MHAARRVEDKIRESKPTEDLSRVLSDHTNAKPLCLMCRQTAILRPLKFVVSEVRLFDAMRWFIPRGLGCLLQVPRAS